ncbi:MAG TPA: site-2 protease family protein [Candidatus Nanoarchaeia archaeon]|nr:site-2 protease family protein [Candidatus Nanoarchaeia archaeon]
MSFILYDIIFLILCLIAFTVFIYKKKHNLKRQGIMYLYPTKIGIVFIDKFTKKYEKVLRALQYPIVFSGYLLMGSMVWFLVKFTFSYLSSTELVHALKVPVLMPLIPYLPELFHLDFLPSFYFTYWIIIIALIALPHEFAHGIFARLYKVTVHSTGFGFLGPFLAAFVEPDDKQMEKRGIFPQLVVLAAGTFSNIIIALICGLLLWVFFSAAFVSHGVIFNTYAITQINATDISEIGGVPIAQLNSSAINSTSLITVTLNNSNITYMTSPDMLAYSVLEGQGLLYVYDNAPAFSSNLSGAIISIDDVKTNSYEKMRSALSEHSPGDNVEIKTEYPNGTVKTYEVTLGDKNGSAYLGVGTIPQQRGGLFKFVYALVYKIKDPNVYYVSRVGDLGMFVYNLLWWSILISLSVALVNMIPMGMFDGGRFFYLTVLGITGKKKLAEKSFKFATWFLLAIVGLLMLKWAFAYI